MPRQKTILIIDDEISILESLVSFFSDEGYLVFSAMNGDDGLKLFFKETIDVVLTDLRMPGKDGLQVMKTIQERVPETPMIVISGAGKKEDIIKALRMGAKDYITKPIEDLDMISHTVHQVLETKRLGDQNKAYRERLEKSESRYRTITENIAEGVFTVDEHENLTYANQVFCNMVNYSITEILTRNLRDISSPDSFNIIQTQTQSRKTGTTDRYVVEMITRKKKTIHVELACSPIFNSDRKYQGSIAVARDITQVVELRKIYQKFLDQKTSASNDVVSICASCKNIRVKKGEWVPVEEYFKDTVFSHGICASCCSKLYPDLDIPEPDKQ